MAETVSLIYDGKYQGNIELTRDEIETTIPGDAVRSFMPGPVLSASFTGFKLEAINSVPWSMFEVGSKPRYWFLPRISVIGTIEKGVEPIVEELENGAIRMTLQLTGQRTIVTPHPRWYGRALAWMYYKLKRKNPPRSSGGL